ncbi:hypothetical protein TgHK011_004901 [Trichoderma gracile]|nr:hypothetical protein TgHK011_004901 [Trichoderma gracile]
MQLSALFVLLPLAAAIPAAPLVEREKFAACKSARDTCLEKCKPSFNALLYPYCSASCNSRYLWCKNEDPVPEPTTLVPSGPIPTSIPFFNLPFPVDNGKTPPFKE